MARKKNDHDDSNGPGRQRDPGDVRRIERLKRDKAKLIEERDHWKRRSEQLEKELEAARRAGKRQAAPFAKDRPQGSGERPGRRRGADYGKQGRRQPPPRVDEVHASPVPTSCPDCGGAVAVDGVSSQYQEELPAVQALVRRFDIEVGHCSQCRRRVQGRHALQTSDALGAAAPQLGPNVAALVVELHTELGMPLEKVARVLDTQFGLRVTKGGLVQLLHRTAARAAPAYAALCEQVRRSPVVTPDETGWRVWALNHWLWVFATPETVYAICDGRGFEHAAAVLGPDFSGVLVRDGWVAYRGFKNAPHQTCVGHLLRRCKDLQAAHPDSPLGGRGAGGPVGRSSAAGPLQCGRHQPARSGDGPRPTGRPARSPDRHRAAVGRRRALRQAPGQRVPGGVPLPVRPVDRRHQLAGGAGHPPPRWSPARCAAATAPARAPTPSRCWRA